MKTRFFISSIVAIAVVISAVYYFGYKTDVANDKKTSSNLRLGMNTIYVSDQIPGKKIVVSFAALEAKGFVVIYEEKSGSPGAIIGQSGLLSAGDNQNISIPILRSSQDSETLFAMLHQDDGDGIFNYAKDRPITDENEEPFMMEFLIDKDAVEAGVISL